MGFNEDIKAHAEKVVGLIGKIQTEEATKMSMIVPFLRLLGYDDSNPDEVCPEYVADVGLKKGEKVDYAILFNNEPHILIECKWCGEDLNNHTNQLFRYFGAARAKFGILTNGIVYKFYSDFSETNRMDPTPFLEIDFRTLMDYQLNDLQQFTKENFDANSISSSAWEMKYTNLVKSTIKDELDNPTEDFIKFILNKIYEGSKTNKIIEKFTPIIRKSLNAYKTDMLEQRILSMSASVKEEREQISRDEKIDTPSPKIETTDDEIEAYHIVRALLVGVVDINDIYLRDAQTYCTIIYKNSNRNRIMRMVLDTKKKQIFIPNDDNTEEKYTIDSLNDLYKYKDQLIASVKRYLIT